MQDIKRIAYAMSTSPLAEKFGFAATGCYFIEYQRFYKEAGWRTFPDLQVGGFKEVCTDLHDSLREADGEVDAMSLRINGNLYEGFTQ